MTGRFKRLSSTGQENTNKRRRVFLDTKKTLCELDYQEPVSKLCRVIPIDSKRKLSQSSDEKPASKRQQNVKIKDIPKFNGKKNEDFDQWRNKSINFMDSLNIPEADKVNLLII